MPYFFQKRWNMYRLWGIEARVNNKSIVDVTFHSSNLLVNETEEDRSVKEANIEDNIIGNVSERMELDVKLSQLNIVIGSCNMHNSQSLEEASTCTVTTKASIPVSDTAHISSEKSVDTDYDTKLNEESVMYEILIAGTTYYKSKKFSM